MVEIRKSALIPVAAVIILLMLYLVFRENCINNPELYESVSSNLRVVSKDSGQLASIATVPSARNDAPLLNTTPRACGEGKLVGNEHHGGWFVCADSLVSRESSRTCIVYSFGLGADWSFDLQLETIGCEIHGFDPSGELIL